MKGFKPLGPGPEAGFLDSTVAGVGSGACAELRCWEPTARQGLLLGDQGAGPFFPIELAEPAWAVCPSGLWDIWPLTISGEKVWTT